MQSYASITYMRRSLHTTIVAKRRRKMFTSVHGVRHVLTHHVRRNGTVVVFFLCGDKNATQGNIAETAFNAQDNIVYPLLI